MSESVFPLHLPGERWPIKWQSVWDTPAPVYTGSGRRHTVDTWSYPIRRLTLTWEVLREYSGFHELQQLAAFFDSRHGWADDFLIVDRDYNLVDNQLISYGDGSRTEFTLIYDRGGFVEPIGRVTSGATTQVFLDGVLTSATLLDFRRLQFGSPPGVGVEIRWTGSFYLRCAFRDNAFAYEEFARHFWRATSGLTLETVKV